MTHVPSFRLRTPMKARDTEEKHRVSSPLELLFDLTFVAAIAQVALQLAHKIADGHGSEGILPFLMVFFAIWWAWMNFTWFASSYDTDDVPYRLLTMLQMAGVLVLAAGVPMAFLEDNFTPIVVGYFIMRVALAAQWIRAGIENPDGRRTAFRYAGGVLVVQLGWLGRQFLPEDLVVWSFLVLAILELCVPMWAERTGTTSWHPHHIAERYGLFTIILLGESVLAATTGVQTALESGLSLELVTVGVSALVLLFALWWLYFLEPAGDGLENHRDLSYVWGYGHYGVFAALAAIGAGLEVSVEAVGEHLEVAPTVVGYAVAIPVGVFLILLWAVHARLVNDLVISPAIILPAAVIVLLIPLATPVLTLTGVVIAVALVCVLVVVGTIMRKIRRRDAAEATVAA